MTVASMRIRDFADVEERADGRLKVTGAAAYVADRIGGDSLWLAYARSPLAHARIVRIDTSEASVIPGVRAILTGADIGPVRFGRRLQDWPALALERVRFVGDRVAAIAADTPGIARRAALLVDVEYEELPALLDAARALDADAPVLHPDAADYTFLGGSRPLREHPNLQGSLVAHKGDPDIERALAGAHLVLEHTFVTARQHQGHLEPHAASVAVVGSVAHVWTTNKSPFSLRTQMASALGMEPERIVVDSGVIGGDFGGKGLSLDEYVCVRLAEATGRRVSAVMSYADELQAANPRHATTVTLRTGVDRTGRIVAHSARFLFDGGAYAAAKPIPSLTPPGALSSLGAYDIPVVHIEALVCYTNNVPAGHMRGPGEVQAAFAGESHVDAIARRLGMDPVAFRRLNAVRAGATDVVGRRIREPSALAVLEVLAADRVHRGVARTDRGPVGAGPTGGRLVARGRGVSLTARHMEGGRMTVRLCALPDGSIVIRTGIPDQGGGAHTVMRRVAAAALGLPTSRFRVVRESTDQATPDLGVGASRVTFIGGRAAETAAVSLGERLTEHVAATTGIRDVTLVDGVFRSTVRSPWEQGWTEAVASLPEAGLEVAGTYDSESEHDQPQDYSFAGYSVEVEVDLRTGAVRVVDAVLAADTGTIINPLSHRGQVEGGFTFGIGAALLEELVIEDGRVQTVHLGDYKLPTILDVPALRIILLPTTGRGAFGAKMAGELSTSGVAPAIANAVTDAIGIMATRLPLEPHRVLADIESARLAGIAPEMVAR
jgi:CO/xanthine dehydrogenase Mo-binding subunit